MSHDFIMIDRDSLAEALRLHGFSLGPLTGKLPSIRVPRAAAARRPGAPGPGPSSIPARAFAFAASPLRPPPPRCPATVTRGLNVPLVQPPPRRLRLDAGESSGCRGGRH
jgi:hypothetical protein